MPNDLMAAIAAAKPYGTLATRHPDYERDAPTWSELNDLYEGGYAVARNAGLYMPPLVGENPESYEARLKSAAYLNYIGQICDYFVASLFSQELNVTDAADASDPTSIGTKSDGPFWATFSKDCDRKGTAYSDVLKAMMLSALLKRRHYIAADFPAVAGPQPLNAAQEQALGVKRGYIYEIPVEQIIDWKINADTGRFVWCIVNRREMERASPDDVREQVTETFKVWTKDDSGAVQWSLFRISYKPEKPPKPSDIVPCVDSGTVNFDDIPILIFELTLALWVGNKLGPVAKEHLQRRSALISAENKNLAAIPVYAAGAEVPAIGGELIGNQEDENRAENFVMKAKTKGFLVTGSGDKVYFAEPAGTSYALVDAQLASLKDEMFRITNQMAASISNNSASLGRSGESKAQDRAAEAVVLAEFGRRVRNFTVQVYTLIARARGEDVVWVPHGLDNFDSEDRASVLAEAVQLGAITIPSRTFNIEWQSHIAGRMLPTLGPATKQQMRKEIEDGVDAQTELKDITRDAQIDALQTPAPGKKPGAAADPKNGAVPAPTT